MTHRQPSLHPLRPTLHDPRPQHVGHHKRQPSPQRHGQAISCAVRVEVRYSAPFRQPALIIQRLVLRPPLLLEVIVAKEDIRLDCTEARLPLHPFWSTIRAVRANPSLCILSITTCGKLYRTSKGRAADQKECFPHPLGLGSYSPIALGALEGNGQYDWPSTRNKPIRLAFYT